MKRNWPNFCARPPASVWRPRPRNFPRGRGTPAGSRRFGRACSARSATNTTPGRCKIWRKRARVWSHGIKSPFAFQARLLGISGLLPGELTRSQKSSDAYLRRVWDCWWRERDEFADCVLPRAVWKFHGLRPANHPQRRLALASHWLADKNLISKIEKWCATEISDGRAALPRRRAGRQVSPASAG